MSNKRENSLDRKILNPEHLETWKLVAEASWQKMIAEIISIFFDFASGQHFELKKALIAGDFKKVKRVAHSLKSSCGNVGAEQAYDILDKIENLDEKQNESIAGLLKLFDRVFELTCAELRIYGSKNQAA